MQITNLTFKEKCDKVIAALEVNRVMAADSDGNYTKEVTPKVITEALAIMRGLAECEPLYASPQAVPAEVKSEPLAQAAQAPDQLPSGGKPIEAPAPTEAALHDVVRQSEDMGLYDDPKTEAQEREASQEKLWSEFSAQYDAYDFRKTYDKYGPSEAAYEQWCNGRAARKS